VVSERELPGLRRQRRLRTQPRLPGTWLSSNESEFDTLHQVSDHLYCYLTKFLFNGTVPLNNRSIVVHLPFAQGGDIAIINPAELSPKVLTSLKSLEQSTGAKIKYLISPGDWHYLFIGAYLKAFPEATAYVPPGRIPSKNPQYPFSLIDITIENPFPHLRPYLEVLNFRGMRDIEDPTKTRPRYELAFYHPESKAFTTADIFMYTGVGEMGAGFKAAGLRFGVLEFHFMKANMILDSEAVAQSIGKILAWKPENYICQHGGLGNMIAGGVCHQLEDLRQWALGLDLTPSKGHA